MSSYFFFQANDGTNIEMGPRQPDESASNLFCWAFVMWMREGRGDRVVVRPVRTSSSRVADSSSILVLFRQAQGYAHFLRAYTYTTTILLEHYIHLDGGVRAGGIILMAFSPPHIPPAQKRSCRLFPPHVCS